MYIVPCYLVYLALSLLVATFAGRALYSNGRVFLLSAFHGDSALADSINRLLLTGFWLINAGYILYALRTDAAVNTPRAAIELACDKRAPVLLVLGDSISGNLFALNRMRRHSPAPQGRVIRSENHILD